MDLQAARNDGSRPVDSQDKDRGEDQERKVVGDFPQEHPGFFDLPDVVEGFFDDGKHGDEGPAEKNEAYAGQNAVSRIIQESVGETRDDLHGFLVQRRMELDLADQILADAEPAPETEQNGHDRGQRQYRVIAEGRHPEGGIGPPVVFQRQPETGSQIGNPLFPEHGKKRGVQTSKPPRAPSHLRRSPLSAAISLLSSTRV